MTDKILVTGDVVVDHHIYEGKRHTASAVERQGVRVVREPGGAMALTRLIDAAIARAKKVAGNEKEEREKAVQDAEAKLEELRCNGGVELEISEAETALVKARGELANHKPAPEAQWEVECPLKMPPADKTPCGHHALAVWKPFPLDPTSPRNPKQVWRADLLMGYGHDESSPDDGTGPCTDCTPELDDPSPATPRVLVLDDAGFMFRHQAAEECWLLPPGAGKQPEWIILKMSAPVCQGDLWHRLKEEHSKKLIVVLSAHELRQEHAQLGSGLSWERTVMELHKALGSDRNLREMASRPQHLIVTFSADGALWLDNTGPEPHATLVFDADGAEGAWARSIPGEAFGYMSCMVAALVRAIMRGPEKPKISAAVKAGLCGMRDLRKLGHGLVSEHPHPIAEELPVGFPAKRLAEVIVAGSNEFAETPVPWTDKERAPYAGSPKDPDQRRVWQIVEMSQSRFGSTDLPSLLGLATQTVLWGEAAIARLPHARFGKLLTADRFEIEALRSIERLMIQYQKDSGAKRPLSIGVFGPPGAGKSFGVHQLANSVFGKEAWREFNLSQFKDVGDLIGAFHQVRDAVLGGATPVVFWDEFDSREYDWLQFLLAPMQDGRFQEGQISHAVGKCVFIFAGATSHTFEEFGPPKPGTTRFDMDAWRKFELKKGPDFHSRLDAYLNVLGPNPRSEGLADVDGSDDPMSEKNDVCAPLRRALLIRAHLGVPKDARLDFDPELLAALLRVPKYTHGARSVEKLVQSLKPSYEGQAIRRSSLPPRPQLGMHVNLPPFDKILDEHAPFGQDDVIEALAAAIHKNYLILSGDKQQKVARRFDKPYADLDSVDKEDNRAAARRIPAALALAGLRLEGGEASSEEASSESVAAIRKHLEYHLERLAEAEHDGWMDQRLRSGWRHGKKRDDPARRHPALVPYAELPDADQDKDRDSVLHFPDVVGLAGYRITWARMSSSLSTHSARS